MIKNLPNIQNEMNVQKSRFNKFGGYNYRSCEDILQEAKRVCEKYGCYVMVTDSIEFIEGRFYVKATAKIVETETGSIETCSAFAREEDNKKGMDSAQLTGATSSYARKYALCGLFAIDDSIDNDSANGESETKGKQQKTASKQADSQSNTGINSNYLGVLLEEIKKATTYKHLGDIHKNNGQFHQNSEFMNALVVRKAELKKAEAEAKKV
ncbi:essential recombination function protein [Bacteroides phage vB_BfrS_23]|nr:essential recombination function protein [Bacteroides phage vB_BfrS_23]